MKRNRSNRSIIAAAAAGTGLAILAVGTGFTRNNQPEGEGQPQMQLPEGWTMEHMMACVEAGTPGEEHAWLAEGAGSWHGKGKMWMGVGAEPVSVEATMTITPIMDGRYFRNEFRCEIPGMGLYHGMGVIGYDIVAEKFIGDWVDNQSTTIMQGEATKSADNTLTWTHSYTCPITRKPTSMKEIDRVKADGSRTMEMHGTDPVSGKNYKMMEFTFTRG